MALISVGTAHLLYLIDSLKLPPEAVADLRMKATSLDETDRADLIKKLAKLLDKPDLRAHLESVWSYEGSRKVHAYRPLVFQPLPASAIVKKLKAAIDPEEPPDDVVSVEFHEDGRRKRKPPHIRIKSAKIDDERASLTVRIKRMVSVTNEDETDYYPADVNVRVRVHLDRADRLMEVYAPVTLGRGAAIHIVESVAGEIPRRRAAADEALRPMIFTESQIKQVATKLGARACSIKGPHPGGEVSKHQLWGDIAKGERVPLDHSKKTVQVQEIQANDERHYVYTFIHDDGFHEQCEVGFNFVGYPQIHLLRRPSRPALDLLMSRMAEVIPVG
jgi:hypothetical protein